MLQNISNWLNILVKPIVLTHRLIPLQTQPIRWKSEKNGPKIDRSKVPQLDERDLQENVISGSGPGGQSVNKSVNCCQLKHKPTGLVVKVHQQRSLEKNRQIARELLIAKLDNLYNGENSVENQKRRIALARIARREAEQKRRQALKEEFKRNIRGAPNNSDSVCDGIDRDSTASNCDNDIYRNKTT